MATPSRSADRSSNPQQFGQYTVVRKIGDGGMGAVYEARHGSLGKRVAIKVLLPEVASKADIASRFIREGQAAARIRHPHVVDVYDVGSDEGSTWLVMELLEGSDLEALLESKGTMTVHELLAILLPVLSALVAAHREGVFHRDLKPANIFLSKDSIGRVHPKVVDFGISKILDDENGFDLTKSATVLGTPYYMAPEQVHSIKRTDARSDQYALGVIAYECLTGRRPFSGESLYELMTAITTTDAVPPDRIVASIPSGVRDAIVRAMRREPDARFASVRELGRALYPYADELARSLWASEFGDRQATPSPSPPAKERAHSSDASTQAAEPASTLATFGAEVRAAAPAAAGAKGSNRRTLWLVGAAAACVIGLTASAMALRHPSQSPVAESSTSAQRLATSEVAPLPSASVAVAASTDAASTDSPAASAAASVAATDAVPGSSARPSEAKTPGHSRKDSAAKTSTDTPARPGDGAVRGANSAWIIR